jgi:hypothetical protein
MSLKKIKGRDGKLKIRKVNYTHSERTHVYKDRKDNNVIT